MVRNLPLESPDPSPHMPHWEPSEPYVEQYFPQQMSWYAAEGPQGLAEDLLRKVREQPWKAMGIALAAGFALACLLGPACRLGARFSHSRPRKCNPSGGDR
jgi:hypothetical protein